MRRITLVCDGCGQNISPDTDRYLINIHCMAGPNVGNPDCSYQADLCGWCASMVRTITQRTSRTSPVSHVQLKTAS